MNERHYVFCAFTIIIVDVIIIIITDNILLTSANSATCFDNFVFSAWTVCSFPRSVFTSWSEDSTSGSSPNPEKYQMHSSGHIKVLAKQYIHLCSISVIKSSIFIPSAYMYFLYIKYHWYIHHDMISHSFRPTGHLHYNLEYLCVTPSASKRIMFTLAF